MQNDIWKYSEIDEMKKQIAGKKIILVGGCFDVLHYGHFSFLKQAKNQGGVLVVALESDQFINERKKRDSVHSQQQRAEILADLQVVDHVLLLPLLTSDEEYAGLVTKITPSVIAVTEGDQHISQKQKYAESVNAEVKVVSSLLKEFSTTQIIANENISSC